jgi:Kef-type K+ transport system membrane component KefB/nucleotide-binding universal stress UspA family protein
MGQLRAVFRKTPRFCLVLGPLLLGSAAPALAAEAGSGHSEVVFLAQLLVLMLTGRLLGEAMQRIGQPSVMGQLLAGILLGPSVLGTLWPDLQQALFPPAREQRAMIDAVSQFGILLLLLLLLTGMETDLKLVRRVGRAAISISLTGVAVPFACGVGLGLLLPQSLLPQTGERLLTALFLGTALSISSVKIVAAVVREMNFTRRNLGQVIVSSAIIEDTVGWIIIAVTFSLAEAGGIAFASVAKSLIGTAAFLVLSFTIGRSVVFHLIRWANDTFVTEFPVITMILVIMGAMALTTHMLGVHSVLGAFVAGVLIGESPILTKHIDGQLRGLIVAFFMPVFFGMAGINADLTILRDPHLALLALGLIAIASVGKFAGAFLGGEIGGLTRREAFALACGMNARGSTEVIVASIGLSLGALTQDLFTMIVAMAFVTTMAMPPMLRYALVRVPLHKEEKERLAREEAEAKGFVANLERLLLAVDDSANGRFAARLAGFIAGRRGAPITVPNWQRNGAQAKAAPAEAPQASNTEVVRAAAESVYREGEDETPLSPVSVTVRSHDKPTAEAVASEASKGYDLLFVGLKTMRGKNGFAPEVARVADAFEGATAFVVGRERQLEAPEQCPRGILLPVSGTDVSRRAAEVAIAIARACECPITALYVANTGAASKRRGRAARSQERAIIKEIVAMADRYDVTVRAALQSRVAPDQAIVAEAKRGRMDLIVMGVNRRPGQTLFFGDTAAAVLDKAPASVMFLAS